MGLSRQVTVVTGSLLQVGMSTGALQQLGMSTGSSLQLPLVIVGGAWDDWIVVEASLSD